MPADAVRPVSWRMRSANIFRRGGRGLQAAQVLRDVEIGFIQRERFDQRCVMAEDRMDLPQTAR